MTSFDDRLHDVDHHRTALRALFEVAVQETISASNAELQFWADVGDAVNLLDRAVLRFHPSASTDQPPPTFTGYRLCSYVNTNGRRCGGSHFTRDHDRVVAAKGG